MQGEENEGERSTALTDWSVAIAQGLIIAVGAIAMAVLLYLIVAAGQ